MRVYDNVKKDYIWLSKLEKGLDINCENDELLSVLSEMYKEYLNGGGVRYIYRTGDEIGISREAVISGKLREIKIRIDDRNGIVVDFGMLYA
jgi:hypothetical protein